LAGHGIKQTIPYKRTGIVSPAEVRWISEHYQHAEDAYNNLRVVLDMPEKSYEDLRGIPEANRQVAGMLRIPTDIHESMTRGRFAVLNAGIPRRELARENRRQIADRLAQMDVVQKFSVMHPLFIRGRKFTFHEDQLVGIQARNPVVYNAVRNSIMRFCEAEPDPELRAMAGAWFQDQLAVLAPEIDD
jgi:hypothetical protein